MKMIIVHDLLKIKGDQVWSITPDTTLLDALKLMAEKEVGALMVMEGDEVKGIISERDLARTIARTGKCPVDEAVQLHMTQDVIVIDPDTSIHDCMVMMTQNKIRHLPVLKGKKLVGLISIGDVVKEVIASQESTINVLENYIEGRGYGQ
jgi:CBS domain-containing protein